MANKSCKDSTPLGMNKAISTTDMRIHTASDSMSIKA